MYRTRGRPIVLVMGLVLAWASGAVVVAAFGQLGIAWTQGIDGTAAVILIGWLAVTLGAVLFLGAYFLKTAFRLNRERLTIQKSVLGFSRNRQVDRTTMECFEQIAVPSGEIAGAFDSDLIVLASHPHHLLSGVEAEATDWLGRRLADFYQLEFKPSAARSQAHSKEQEQPP